MRPSTKDKYMATLINRIDAILEALNMPAAPTVPTKPKTKPDTAPSPSRPKPRPEQDPDPFKVPRPSVDPAPQNRKSKPRQK